MRLDPKQEKYGQPVIKIREIIRHAMAERLRARTKGEIIERISEILYQSKSVAGTVLNHLIKDEYIVLKKERCGDHLCLELTATEIGRRFGVAKANPAISREKADQLLEDLLERIKSVNENEELAYRVERARVFGSYLTDKQILGDLDVAYKLTRRKEGEFRAMNQKRIEVAASEGRRFSNYIEQLYWPKREVELMLKTKKKGLSLHDEDEDDVVNKTASMIVYEFKSNS